MGSVSVCCAAKCSPVWWRASKSIQFVVCVCVVPIAATQFCGCSTPISRLTISARIFCSLLPFSREHVACRKPVYNSPVPTDTRTHIFGRPACTQRAHSHKTSRESIVVVGARHRYALFCVLCILCSALDTRSAIDIYWVHIESIHRHRAMCALARSPTHQHYMHGAPQLESCASALRCFVRVPQRRDKNKAQQHGRRMVY